MSEFVDLGGGVAGHVRGVPAFDADGWTESPSGLLVPGSAALSRRFPVAIDLFAGCGGFSLGLIQAGFHVVAGLDSDAAASATYLHNLGAYPLDLHFATDDDRERFEAFLEAEQRRKGRVMQVTLSGGNWRDWGDGVPPVGHFFFGDVRRFTAQQIIDAIGMEKGEVDLVVGGPPCQGFSHAGKREVMDPRNSLVFDFARLVVGIQPKALVMENVPGIVSMVTSDGIPVVDALCRILEDGGFGVYDSLRRSLLSTSGCGAALRQRSARGQEEAAAVEDQPHQLQLELG